MLLFKEAGCVEHTHLNEFGEDIAILEIFMVSDGFDEDLSKNVPILMRLNFSDNTRVIAILLLRGHLNQKL